MRLDLLLEVGTEEIPAAFFPRCLEDLARLIREGLEDAELTHGEIRTLGTPRRLTVWVRELAPGQEDRVVEEIGPPARIAFDAEGRPTKPAEGFAKKLGIPVEALQRKSTPKGEYLAATIEVKGRPTEELLPAILQNALRSLPWKKSMRWGRVEEAFARPIHWILARYGETVIPFEYAGVKSGGTSRGHRFLANHEIEIPEPAAYVERLREAEVLVDPAERRDAILRLSREAAEQAGGKLVEDEALLDEITWLVELPLPVLGTFDPSFLELPREVLVSEMREHQRYLAVSDPSGDRLLPSFVAVANTRVRDPQKIRRGFERVLRARLSDARFFFDEDRKTPLVERVPALERVTFQQKLGSIHEKVERIRALGAHLAEALALSVPEREHVERAATLAKADLVTGMVGEFPDLQGVMGREYALASGEPAEVAQAIFEHYLPRGQGDELPASHVGAVVGVADRLDTIVGIFGIGKPPTGTADPFGLRRACLGIIRVVLEKGYRFSLGELLDRALDALAGKLTKDRAEVRAAVLDFFAGRLRNHWAEDHPVELVDAVLASGFDDLVETHARLLAVAAHLGDESFRGLAEGFSRTNIVEKAEAFEPAPVDVSLFETEAERELFQAFESVRERVRTSLASGDFSEVVKTFTELRGPLDRFFTEVMVMVEDPALRQNRLRLLHEIRALFGRVADFGRMDLRKAAA